MGLPQFKLIPTPFIPLSEEGQRPLLCRLIIPSTLPPGNAEIAVSDGTLPLWSESFVLNGKEQRITLEVPGWMIEKPISLMMSIMRRRRITVLSRADIDVVDVPPVTVHILQSPHSIIPFGPEGAATLSRQLDLIRHALTLVELDETASEDTHFKWTVDVSAPVIHFLRTQSEQDIDRLRHAVTLGKIGISPLLCHPLRDAGVFSLSKAIDEFAFLSESLDIPLTSVMWIADMLPSDTQATLLAAAGIDTVLHLRPASRLPDFGSTVSGHFRWMLDSGRHIDVITGEPCFNGNLAGIPGDMETITDALIDLWINQSLGKPFPHHILVHVGAANGSNGMPTSGYSRMIPRLEKEIGGGRYVTATLASYVEAMNASRTDPLPELNPYVEAMRNAPPRGDWIGEYRGMKRSSIVWPGLELIDESTGLNSARAAGDVLLSMSAAKRITDVPSGAQRLSRLTDSLFRSAASRAMLKAGSGQDEIWTFNPLGIARRDMVRVPIPPDRRMEMPDTVLVAAIDPDSGEETEPIQAQWETITGTPILIFPADFQPWQQRRFVIHTESFTSYNGATDDTFSDSDGKFVTPFYEIDIAEPARGLAGVFDRRRNRSVMRVKSGLQLGEAILVMPPGIKRGATNVIGKKESSVDPVHIQRAELSRWRVLARGPHQAVLALDIINKSMLVGVLIVRLYAEFDRIDMQLLIKHAHKTGDNILYWSLPLNPNAPTVDTMILNSDDISTGLPFWVADPFLNTPLGSQDGFKDFRAIGADSAMMLKREPNLTHLALAVSDLPLIFTHLPTANRDGSIRPDAGAPAGTFHAHREPALQVPLYAFLGILNDFSTPPDESLAFHVSLTADTESLARSEGAIARFGLLHAAPIFAHLHEGTGEKQFDAKTADSIPIRSYPNVSVTPADPDNNVILLWLKPQPIGWRIAVYNPNRNTAEIRIDINNYQLVTAEMVSPSGKAQQALDVNDGGFSLTVAAKDIVCVLLSDRDELDDFKID